MCSPFDPLSCADAIGKGIQAGWDLFTGSGIKDAVASSAFEALFGWIADGLRAGVKSLAILLAGWILVPSINVDIPDSPAAQLRAWMLPLTVLIATAGIVWQGITMAITRKGEPMLQAVRGAWNTALWGAVGIAATQAALRAGDSYATWILQRSIIGESANPVDTLGTKIADMAVPEAGIALIVLVLLLPIILLVTLAQILLMIFREGSVVILAGMLQLAAAGSFTRATSGWLHKVLPWMLALVAYKPVAATVYATGFALMGSTGTRNFVMGLAVMLLAIVAMPALMKFFNWTVGSLGTGGGGLGMLGAAVAAGVHAGASLRGVGGYTATDHARYLDSHGPAGGDGQGGTPPATSPPAPPGPGTAGSPAGPGGAPTGAGTTAPAGPGAAGTTGTAAGTTAAGGTGVAAGTAAGAGTATAGTAAAAGGAAATGVGIPVAAGIVAAQAAARAGRQAADTATDTMNGGR